MPSFRTGRVTAIVAERAGLQRVLVDGEPAVVLTALIGPVAEGDRVVVNTTAVDLELGTGGDHFVHWNLARSEWSRPGPGHIMKLRYTSLQADTGAAEEGIEEEALPTLDGLPVVACALHSQVAAVAAGFRAATGSAKRLVLVMTDGGALPLALSDLVAGLDLAGTVTAGHAFGGDIEAVNVPSAIWLARSRLDADAVVVAPGPGVVGTGTPLGTTALDVVAALDMTVALGGQPIIAVRASAADQRERHRGISHHTMTALTLVRSSVTVPLPPELRLADERHEVVTVDVPDLDLPAGLTTMGRGPSEDPVFFRAAAAAGLVAGRT